jgi:hypothetical protein
MRLVMLVALGCGLALTAAPSFAQQGDRAFCSLDGHGRMLCYYDRFEQCIEAMRGVQGDCFQNPNRGRQTEAAPAKGKKKK